MVHQAGTQGSSQANGVKPKNRYNGGREVLTSGPRKEGRSRKVLTPGKYKVKTILLVRIRAVVKPLKRAKTVVVPR